MTATMEERILEQLNEIQAGLEETRGNTRVLAVKLFGSTDLGEEQESARLPVMERRLNDHAARLKVLEETKHSAAGCTLAERLLRAEKKMWWLERAAWTAIGALCMLGWMLNRVTESVTVLQAAKTAMGR